MRTIAEDDERFGELTVQVDSLAGLVEVSGAAIPTAVLRRLDGARPDQHCLIGSRDRTGLQLRLDGAEATILPAYGGLTRRSYRVDVWQGEVAHRLRPTSHHGSTLWRDGRVLGVLRVVAAEEMSMSAQWNDAERVEPSDAAVGYLLAAAFGTGAQNGLVTLVKAFFS